MPIWERYLANQERMRQHRWGLGSKGSPRNGPALLAGIIVCDNCGRRLQTDYRSNAKSYDRCAHHPYVGTEQTCFSLRVTPVDDLVAEQVLRAL